MQIKKRVFTYPVLNNAPSLSSYNGKTFSLEYDLQEDVNNLFIKNVRCVCDSEYIKEKVAKGLIKVICIVECSNTVFRKKYRVTLDKDEAITISKNDLSEKVELSMFAYATSDMTMKSTNDFDEDYQGIDYQIEKYNILCANDGISFRLAHEDKNDNLAKSIFSVIPIEESNIKNYEVDVKTKKIEISMSQENYLKYRNVYQSDILTEEFFCVLLVPALTEALFVCKEYINGGSVDTIEDLESHYNWFRSIIFAYKTLKGEELTVDEFKKISPVVLSQELLGTPLNRALEAIENSQDMIGDDEDE